MSDLSRLESVELRDVWKHEAGDFTPWLALEDNLYILGETLGLQLELIETEKAVGNFSADIVCRDGDNDRTVLIENQLEKTDHSHLGQIFTYAAGIDAVTIIWIAKQFTEEHRAAVDWLNHISGEELQFFAIEIQLWKIGSSAAAPRFNIVSKPNDWVREVKRVTGGRTGLTENRKLQLELWTAFTEYLEQSSEIRSHSPHAKNWVNHPAGPGMQFVSIASYFNNETNSWNMPEVRVEFYLQGKMADERYRKLKFHQSEVEAKFGEPLFWYAEEGLNHRKIYVRKEWDFREKDTWPDLFIWYKNNIEALRAALQPVLKEFGP